MGGVADTGIEVVVATRRQRLSHVGYLTLAATAVSIAGLIGLLADEAIEIGPGAVWEAWLAFYLGGIFTLLTGIIATLASRADRQTRRCGLIALGYCAVMAILLSASTSAF